MLSIQERDLLFSESRILFCGRWLGVAPPQGAIWFSPGGWDALAFVKDVVDIVEASTFQSEAGTDFLTFFPLTIYPLSFQPVVRLFTLYPVAFQPVVRPFTLPYIPFLFYFLTHFFVPFSQLRSSAGPR